MSIIASLRRLIDISFSKMASLVALMPSIWALA
jgi:hypothetical protein